MHPAKKQSFMGTLALRVLTICILLIVLPLIIYSLFLFRSEYRSKLADALLSVNFLGREKTLLFNEWISTEQTNLNTIEILSDLNDQAQGSLNQKFKNIAYQNKFSSLFYLKILSNGQNICTNSSSDPLIGKTKIFTSQSELTQKDGFSVFAAENPIHSLKEFYLSKAVDGGVLFLGVPICQLLQQMAPFKDPPFPYRLSILTSEGTVYSIGKTHIPLDEVLLYSSFERSEIETFKSKISWWSLFARKTDRIGMKFPTIGTDLFLVVDIAEKDFLAVSSSRIWKNLGWLLFCLIVLGGACALILILRIAKPLKQLSEVMLSAGKGRDQVRYVSDPMGFEINILGTQFNQMINSLMKQMQETQSERLEKEILAQELKIGHEIQKSILPFQLPSFESVEIASGFMPAKEVGGDFYDLLVKNPHELVLAVADAEGKGISACLYSLCVRSMLRSFVISEDDLQEAIAQTNSLFCQDAEVHGTFVTAWIASYDSRRKTLTYHCCGHPPAILRRADGNFEELKTVGLPLGIQPYDTIEIKEVALGQGDLLILYTDGIIEAHNDKQEHFGKERLLQVLKTNASRSPAEIASALNEAIAAFAKNTPQADDITFLILRF